MRRRPVLRALFGTGLVTSFAGCSGLFEGDVGGADDSDDPPLTPPSSVTHRSTPQSSSLSESSQNGPYRAAGAPALDQPRGVHVRNLGSTARFVTVVVTAVGTTETEEVFADSAAVPPGETVSFSDLVATAGRYGVLVETAEGSRTRYDWEVVAALDDLWVDLTPDISFRRPVVCFTDCPFAVADGEHTVAYDVPSDVGVAEALGRTPALAIDNDTPNEARARLKIWHQGQLRLASGYVLPPDVRALVPVLPAGRRYDLILRTDAGEVIYDWQPSVRTTLYASLADGPTFRCGYATHDLRVRNETDAVRRVRVRVLTGDETLFERSFEVDPNAVSTAPSAVDPAGPFRFEIETDGGRRAEFNWVRCAPNGPITVVVNDSGVYVSVQPLRRS